MKCKFSALAILVIAAATKVNAQCAAYATTTAEQVTPISISKTTHMYFGRH